MARPQKPRFVAEDAPASYYKPQGIRLLDLDEVVLTLDGFEAMRHVDVDGLDQVEAARRMGVSRSTLSRILAEARRTVATALTRGLALRIEGGTITRPRHDGCAGNARPDMAGPSDARSASRHNTPHSGPKGHVDP